MCGYCSNNRPLRQAGSARGHGSAPGGAANNRYLYRENLNFIPRWHYAAIARTTAHCDSRVGDRGTSGVRGVVRHPHESDNSNNGSTVHPTPPEIPLRLRRALSGKPESSTALRMTRAAAQKLSLRRIKIGTALIAVPNEGSKNFCRESFEGVWGDFFKSPPKKKLFQKFPLIKPALFFQKKEIHAKSKKYLQTMKKIY